ncbi:hypothetical protein CYMTET_10299 [Cymbomonas tetramitiformis]|uniref:Uncharacterized protein n=1 Tax=Cymbomonas tetramitiformis TaxID=36881 RepID=A0AAE0GPW6_9CHLO|nr:hypothetical protein CYMTET_10299 [Cymbomonas tetramitiformis]
MFAFADSCILSSHTLPRKFRALRPRQGSSAYTRVVASRGKSAQPAASRSKSLFCHRNRASLTERIVTARSVHEETEGFENPVDSELQDNQQETTSKVCGHP